MRRDSEPFNHLKSWLVQPQTGKELDMTRHASLKTVSALTALVLTAMLATSAWANGPVLPLKFRDLNIPINQASVSVLTAEFDVVAPLAAVTSGKRSFTKRRAQRLSASS